MEALGLLGISFWILLRGNNELNLLKQGIFRSSFFPLDCLPLAVNLARYFEISESLQNKSLILHCLFYVLNLN